MASSVRLADRVGLISREPPNQASVDLSLHIHGHRVSEWKTLCTVVGLVPQREATPRPHNVAAR
jgi:hypothetical protein